MRREDIDELRAYCRGFLAGEYSAQLDELVAYRAEALVLIALRELGASQAGAQEVLEQARHDAHLSIPDLTEIAGRMVAASMVAATLRKRLAAMEAA